MGCGLVVNEIYLFGRGSLGNYRVFGLGLGSWVFGRGLLGNLEFEHLDGYFWVSITIIIMYIFAKTPGLVFLS